MDKELGDFLFEGINEQGFLFQEKCADTINENWFETHWGLAGREYPVTIKDKDTRIDIVIQHSEYKGKDMYGVLECKNINPMYNCWLFGNSNYDSLVDAEIEGGSMIQALELSTAHGHDFQVNPVKLDFNIHTLYVNDWWMQINLQSKPGQKRSDPEPIENAMLQACQGVGGLMSERLRQFERSIKGNVVYFDENDACFIPIVVTTAQLFIINYNLDNVDLTSGKINQTKISFSGLPTSTSPVKHVLVNFGAPSRTIPDELYDNLNGADMHDLELFNYRGIFIVNSKYLVDFLKDLQPAGL